MGTDLTLVFVAPFIVAFVLIVLLIIFWVILMNKYTATPSDSSRNKPLLFGCGSLIISFACLVTVPITFILTLAMGMGTGSGSLPASDVQFYENLTIVLMIILLLSIIVSILAGIAGVIMLIAWAIKKYKTGLT